MTNPAPSTDRLIAVDLALESPSGGARNPEVEQERGVAIYDLLEGNTFRLAPREEDPLPAGPYALTLGLADRRLTFDVRTEGGDPAGQLILSFSPLRKVIRDYFAICESYFDAVKRLPAAQIEAIDMGRRGLHNEGAQILKDRLSGKIEIDDNTARRLFTLVSVLHYNGSALK